MFAHIALAVCVFSYIHNHFVGAIECYTCSNVTGLPDCTAVTTCPVDSTCGSEYTTVQGTRFYTLGCRNILSCPNIGVSSIVGRAASNVTDSSACSDCCHTTHCNRQLCQDPDPLCADEKDYDCAKFGAVINVCAESSHIKPYCKRFCGFCNAVDGGWSAWSQWSSCDVTCGNGTRSRTRTCTDPAPSNGGVDCGGKKQEYEPCTKDICPVHGGWSTWSPWGSCSVSCDIGLQRKDRSCSNPYPGRGGDHCYGDSRADRLCFPGACANGSWSAWGAWGSCDKTCGGGIRVRARNCDSPAPSLTGQYCIGYPVTSELCNPSSCLGPVVFFAKQLFSTTVSANTVLRFTDVVTNIGGGYDASTGIFTAPANGTYSFNVQFCASSNSYADVGLIVNGVRVTNMLTYGNGGHTCRTLSVPVMLHQGDKVKAETDNYSGHFVQDTHRIHSFSGNLVYKT